MSTPVVQTKLRPPRPLRPLIARPGLEARLQAAADEAFVILVLGPSGTGKTSLLTRWTQTAPAAWLTVDARDNDPARFWIHVAAAITGESGAGADESGAGADEAAPGSDAFAAALAERVAASGERPVLVLDEYEQIVEPSVHQQLDLFVRTAGDALTTVIAGRARPPLRFDQLSLAGRLATFGWFDLRMNEEEARRLLLGTFGVDAGDDQVAALVESTDGWAGGLALAAGGLRRGTPDRAADADHLLDHVWAGLAPDLREFVLDTAVLERFSIGLADAVHGNAADLVDRLRGDGVFLLAEEDGAWFRYQRPFRWAVARRLSAHDPEREREAHRSAAFWYAEHDDRDSAIDHALRAGDHGLAVDLIGRAFDDARGWHTMERWLQALPDEAIDAAAGDFVDRALEVWCGLGRRDERDRWSRIARRESPPGRPADVWRLCLPRERGDLASALRHGREAVRRWPAPMTATQARISLGRGLLLAGRTRECQELLNDVEELWPKGTPPRLAMAVEALRGLAAYREDDHAEARVRLGLAGAAYAEAPGRPRPQAVPEYVILKALLTGDPEPLRALIDRLGPDHSMAAFASLMLARCYLGQGEPERAAEHVAAARERIASFASALGLVDLLAETAAEIAGEPRAVAADLLSDRELAVLQYLRSDLTLKEIAAHLYVSVNTIKTHARHVYRKLGVAGRHALLDRDRDHVRDRGRDRVR
ncbi:LuxR C-terminal-related transcriptional regulator [Actinomadura fulvescens]|uniref:HTH luxR-type domain-containing protein n=1 Tax=Actinomadura fulvescens TaxID=46160 RepID=A0ABP6CUC0_9ACTN